MAETFIPIPVETITGAAELPSKTYRLDLDKGRIVGKVDGISAVNQAIRKAIITPRFKCLIYDNQYGNEGEAAVTSKDATRGYTEATLEGFIVDALRPDTRILSVSDFKTEFDGDWVRVSFLAETIFGAIEVEEVI